MTATRIKLEELKRRKLNARNSIINKYDTMLQEDPDKDLFLSITLNDAGEIVQKITVSRELTCELVMKAFIWHAISAQKRVNCLTEVLFEEALQTAKKYDIEFNLDGIKRGMLHGIPISIKDNLNIKNYDSTVGSISNAFRPAIRNQDCVNALIEEGAIIFVKTNVPQTLLSFECSNPLWGITCNPHNLKYSPGGSSGGEASLIASGGSIMGIGNDVGGSLRIPAHFCGIYSMKPTHDRISNELEHFVPSQGNIQVANGPMTNSMQNLKILSKVLINFKSSELHVPWKDYTSQRSLRVGYIEELDSNPITPTCKRVLNEVVDKLTAAGYEIIPVKLSNLNEGLNHFYAILTADGAHQIVKHIGKEPIEKHLKLMIYSLRVPGIFKKISEWLYIKLGGNVEFGRILNACRKLSVSELWEIQAAKEKFAKKALREIESLELDCILCPGFASPANRLDTFSMIPFAASYCFLWNILDLPVGTIPAGKVDPKLDQREGKKPNLLQGFDYMLYKAGSYNADEMENLPVGIQIVATKKYQEEKLIYCMTTIDSIINKSTEN